MDYRKGISRVRKNGIKGWISDRMVGEMGFIFNRPFLSHGIVRVNSTSAHLAFKKGCFLGGCVWAGGTCVQKDGMCLDGIGR